MIAGLSNMERLRALYDPDHVSFVETLNDGAPVQVCIESRMLNDRSGTGVATYARTLANCVAAAGAQPVILDDASADGTRRPAGAGVARWLSAARGGKRPAVPREQAAGTSPEQWRAFDIFREAQVFFNLHGRLLPVTFDRPPEVMHWTYPVPVYVKGARNLYTIHDLIPITHPELTTIATARHWAILRAIVQRAHGLVTVSEATRRLVIDRFALPETRVTNTFQTVDTPLQPDPPLPAPFRSGRYFLFCGRVERRKNLSRLARAHADSGTAMPLVIVGPEVDGEAALEAELQQYPSVHRLPWVPRNELIGLMRRARALLFPSLAEGFGLPIAEAMTLGCPVLTGSCDATAEIAGGAALLVDPYDLAAITRAIHSLDRQDELCAGLRTAGFDRGRFFAADRYVRRLRALYAGALAAGDHGPC